MIGETRVVCLYVGPRAFARASLERSSLEALKGIFHFLGVFAQEALPDRQIVN